MWRLLLNDKLIIAQKYYNLTISPCNMIISSFFVPYIIHLWTTTGVNMIHLIILYIPHRYKIIQVLYLISLNGYYHRPNNPGFLTIGPVIISTGKKFSKSFRPVGKKLDCYRLLSSILCISLRYIKYGFGLWCLMESFFAFYQML
jgi:hypothetical protein